MKKNVLATKNEMVDGEINLGREKSISENVSGLCMRKATSIKPQIINLSSQPLINTKTGSQLWKDEGNAGKCERKMPNQLQMCEEMKHMGKEWNGNTFMGVFLPHKKKYDFPN